MLVQKTADKTKMPRRAGDDLYVESSVIHSIELYGGIVADPACSQELVIPYLFSLLFSGDWYLIDYNPALQNERFILISGLRDSFVISYRCS